ncbi:hypothetical protein [Streptomyces sp. AC550_RSS872]|uniref:hypothetical protein n=1 Tax=Streptomyces sp. AC550_RSS872 TaxID=2823689 RepID=UPI001C27A374|nr:hypothetical protein [Streptomyces sp. AC550_RSS872]
MRIPKAGVPGLVLLSAGALLTACSDSGGELDYQTGYASHRPLRVTGYPSTGSLETVQQVVWRLADGDVDGLAALDTEGGDHSAARDWVETYGTAARAEVSADFLDEGSVRQDVVLHFAGPRRTQELTVRIGDDDTWGVVLDAPDPTPAAPR